MEQKIKNKKYVLAKDLDVNHLWLLEEGHSLRSQVVNLCELKSQEQAMHQWKYRNIEKNGGNQRWHHNFAIFGFTRYDS